MSIDQMRTAVEKVYPGEKWKRKVVHMSDNQIIAIYYDFLKKKKVK